ncbi:hypothetical protein ACFS07_36080 [Undibacterium arcticum]
MVRAISDMRLEVLADQNDRAAMEVVAQEKNRWRQDQGRIYQGRHFPFRSSACQKNSRYVLQHTGKEYVAIHRASAFNFAPEVGTNVRIEYQDRKAKVADRGVIQKVRAQNAD